MLNQLRCSGTLINDTTFLGLTKMRSTSPSGCNIPSFYLHDYCDVLVAALLYVRSDLIVTFLNIFPGNQCIFLRHSNSTFWFSTLYGQAVMHAGS